MGELLKKNICSQKKLILSFKRSPYFKRAALSRTANRKSQKLFPFVKMIENHEGVLILLNNFMILLLLKFLKKLTQNELANHYNNHALPSHIIVVVFNIYCLHSLN